MSLHCAGHTLSPVDGEGDGKFETGRRRVPLRHFQGRINMFVGLCTSIFWFKILYLVYLNLVWIVLSGLSVPAVGSLSVPRIISGSGSGARAVLFGHGEGVACFNTQVSDSSEMNYTLVILTTGFKHSE